jgi:hypothetical protein
MDGQTQIGAVISDCREYRYVLWRQWDPAKPTVLFVMLNPSTADEQYDDATIRRCMSYAKLWGFGMLRVVNLYALRSRHPGYLAIHPAPVGPQNDRHIAAEAGRATLIVTAWGASEHLKDRDKAVLAGLAAAVPDKLCYLRRTRDGHPGHPLYLPRDLKPVLWPNPVRGQKRGEEKR